MCLVASCVEGYCKFVVKKTISNSVSDRLLTTYCHHGEDEENPSDGLVEGAYVDNHENIDYVDGSASKIILMWLCNFLCCHQEYDDGQQGEYHTTPATGF